MTTVEEVSTISEAVIEQTTPVEQQEEQTSESPAEATQEPETNEQTGTETAQEEEKTEVKTVDWEKVAKDNQAAFTKSQQELSDIRKQIEELKPKEAKIVDDNGGISQEYKQKHQFEVDNQEFLAYENLSRGITDLAVRQEVEDILREAQQIYGYDKNAYSQAMDKIKSYFMPSVIEKITKGKIEAEQSFETKYKTELQKSIEEKAKAVTEKIQAIPEVFTLVDDKSENFSPDVFMITKQLFDKYGDIDTDMMQKSISSIKALGVKEYLAQKQLEAQKTSATLPTGQNVKEAKSDLPTAIDIAENPQKYGEYCEKFGMDKIDEIIMKGTKQ